jgi:predicted extracellular nuclease
MKITLSLLITFSIFSLSYSQKERSVAFYNVENLFDTIDGVNDDAEFLPAGKNNWTSKRYEEKIQHINQVIQALQYPVIMGFCEVENQQVMQDVLTFNKRLKKYGIVHYDSPDARGIDVGMVYDQKTLKVVSSGKLRFVLPGQTEATTRDIVWAKFRTKKDTIFCMVNHWPSRRSGQDESEPLRLKAAETARVFIDSVLQAQPATKIVFMGDLNDHPSDKAPKKIAERLVPMIDKSSGIYGGTHNYKDEWDVLDHLMVSNGFMTSTSMKAISGSGKIHSFDFLITEYKGKMVPFRTYAGTKYLGGYSDHLPVSIRVSFP